MGHGPETADNMAMGRSARHFGRHKKEDMRINS